MHGTRGLCSKVARLHHDTSRETHQSCRQLGHQKGAASIVMHKVRHATRHCAGAKETPFLNSRCCNSELPSSAWPAILALPHSHLDMAIAKEILHKRAVHPGHACVMNCNAKGQDVLEVLVLHGLHLRLQQLSARIGLHPHPSQSRPCGSPTPAGYTSQGVRVMPAPERISAICT